MKYNLDLVTTEYSSKYRNSKKFIVLHHTGSTNFVNTTRYLARRKTNNGRRVYASAHYTVGLNGELGRIGNDNYILWHAGTGSFGGIKNTMNSNSIGIEVVSNGKDFTKKQTDTLEKLVKELSEKYNIPAKNIIRHKDYSPSRKWDIGDNFYKIAGHSTYQNWIKALFTKDSVKDTENPTDFEKGVELGLLNSVNKNSPVTVGLLLTVLYRFYKKFIAKK